MASSEYYWARDVIEGWGKMWFLLNLQEADSSGGGTKLLGSVVEEIGSIFVGHYPAPYPMTSGPLILDQLRQRKDQLGITGDIVEEQRFAATQSTISITKHNTLKADVGPFPSLPASLNLDIDYSRMSSIQVALCAGTKMQFIPTDCLARLYRSVCGEAAKVDPNLAIRIDDNYIVDQILLAQNFSVTFQSEEDFDAQFAAKLTLLQGVTDVGATVSAEVKDKRSAVVSISNGPWYLIAFKVINWDDLG